ncbi:MAG: CapA family protein, partial [Chloroflexi bacterium]|nr:CapA family protein [Chloroflexota bacterium]
MADIPPLPPVLPERQASEEILEDSHPESVPPQKANTSQFVRADGTAGEVRPLWTRPVGEENPLAPTSTSRPSRLAVEQRVRDAFDTYFTGLAERYGDLIILSYPRNAPGDDEIVRQTVDGLIHWGQPIDESAQLLREEPFAAVAHVLVTPRDVSLRALAAMATGKDQTYTMVCGDDGGLVRALLGVDRLSEATVWVKGWEEAKEYVATHPNTWALLPWAYVDHRVQTLVVDGVRLRPEDLRGYPLVRRLWLEVVGALDAAVIDDLLAALHYDAGPTVELVAVGDIMLGRLVGERILASSPDYPFQGEGIGELLAADVTVGNLECPISEQGQPQSKTYTFRAPPSAVEGLVSAGFDMLSLANNHCNDFGTEALLDTFDILRDRGILYMGAGRTITEAYALRMMDVNG